MAQAPIPTLLPPLQASSSVTGKQWETLLGLMDAAVPPVVAASAASKDDDVIKITDEEFEEAFERIQKTLVEPPSREQFAKYLAQRPSDDPKFVEHLKRVVLGLPDDGRKKLTGVLDLMETKLGGLVVTGHMAPISTQPLLVKEAIVRSWSQSWFTVWRMLAKSITSIAETVMGSTNSLLLELIGYTDHPSDYKQVEGYKYDFAQFEPGTDPAVIETDVVIVGSGCGGAVCAKVLAEAGHKVIVVDKGYHFAPSRFPMTQVAGGRSLFEQGGVMASDDQSINVVAASCWGGGGTINWSVSLQPQGYVRQEWADQGLPFFATAEFQQCLDRVCEFMGVTDKDIRHNHAAEALLEGSRKLGWTAKVAPQNTNGAEHYCGQCHLGCGNSGKNGTAVSWLPTAAKAGAQFIEGFDASKVLFEQSKSGKKATGIIGTWVSRDKNGDLVGPDDERVTRTVEIKAKRVIVSAGTLNSPLLLLRSGLKNRHIGKNLHLHCVNTLGAMFDKDLLPWQGSSITSICTTFENMDGKGHGVKLETTCMLPMLQFPNYIWDGGLDFKLKALKFRQMNGFIPITRDRDTGSVYPDPVSGKARINYSPSEFDRANSLKGLLALAKLAYIQGATEISPYIPGVPTFKRTAPAVSGANGDSKAAASDIDHGINDPAFAEWLAKFEAIGNRSPAAPFASAHQMGTCRMGSSPSAGVVDPVGRVWETQGLYVSDASVFPSASGVNPMVTNMGISDWISRGIAKDLDAEKGNA